jgi:hypothetical protein
MAERSDVPLSDPEAKLEQALIEEYLHEHRYSAADLRLLPENRRLSILRDAEVYAAGRMAEIEARWHYIADLHRHE